jgi:hypothetical protein
MLTHWYLMPKVHNGVLVISLGNKAQVFPTLAIPTTIYTSCKFNIPMNL